MSRADLPTLADAPGKSPPTGPVPQWSAWQNSTRTPSPSRSSVVSTRNTGRFSSGRAAFDHRRQSYTGAMSTESIASPTSAPESATPPPTLRVESAAIYLALLAGAVGGVYGLIIALVYSEIPLRGEWSFGIFA